MKKLIVILMALSLAVMVTGQENLDSGSLRVGLVNQEPDPVGPGEYVDIRVQVDNLGSEDLQGVILEVRPEFPFTLDPGEDSVAEIGTLSAFQNGDRAVIKKYRLRVNDNAVEGSNIINVRAREGTGNWDNYEFEVNIRTSDASLAIESVTTEPETVEPGKDATVQVKVKNLADSTLKDISVLLDLSIGSIATTADLDALPFATIDSGTEKRMKRLTPGKEAVFTFKIRAYPTADSRVYKIPVQIEYKDELNTEYTENSLIGVVVNSKPDISSVLEDSEIEKAGQKGEITIKIINKGLTDIKFVDIQLGDSDKYDLLSEREVYIGNIDSDDYDTADYELYVDSTVSGNVKIPIHYEYMDANNNKYSVDNELELRLFSDEETEKFGNGDQADTKTIVIVAVLVGAVLLFIIWRIYKRSKS